MLGQHGGALSERLVQVPARSQRFDQNVMVGAHLGGPARGRSKQVTDLTARSRPDDREDALSMDLIFSSHDGGEMDLAKPTEERIGQGLLPEQHGSQAVAADALERRVAR